MAPTSLAAGILAAPNFAGAADVAGVCIFIALIVFGGIASAIKKAKEQQEAEKMRQLLQQQWKRPQPGAPPVAAVADEAPPVRGEHIPFADEAPPAAGGLTGVAALRAALTGGVRPGGAAPPAAAGTTRRGVSFDEWSTQRRAAAAAKPAAFTEGTGEHHVGEEGQLAPSGRISDAPVQRSDAVAAPPAVRPREQSAASADLPDYQPTPERRLSEKSPAAGAPAARPRAPVPTAAAPTLLGLLPAYLNDVQKAIALAEILPPRTGPRGRRR